MTGGWIMTLLLTAARALGGEAEPRVPPAAEARAAAEPGAAADPAAVAEAVAAGAVERSWASPRAYERFLVGVVALERGDPATAVRALREARLLDPEAAAIRRCLGEAEGRLRAGRSTPPAADLGDGHAGPPPGEGGAGAACASGGPGGSRSRRLAPPDPAP